MLTASASSGSLLGSSGGLLGSTSRSRGRAWNAAEPWPVPSSAPASLGGDSHVRATSPASLMLTSGGAFASSSSRLPRGLGAGGLSRKASAPTLGAAAALGLSISALGSSSAFGSTGGWALQSSTGGPLGRVGGLAERSRCQAERCARVNITIETEFDIGLWVSLESGQLEGSDLPLVVSAGNPCTVSYVGDAEGVVGSLVLEGFRESIPFQVRPATKNFTSESFVVERGKVHATVSARVAGSPEDARSAAMAAAAAASAGLSSTPALPADAGESGAAGAAAELWMTGSCPSAISLRVRRVREAEVRCLEARRERREGPSPS